MATGCNNDVLMACAVGDLPWLKRGLSLGADPKAKNAEGASGLHLAVRNGRLDCVKYLLDNCDISVDIPVTKSGDTPLHWAVLGRDRRKAVQCVKLLLDRGAHQSLLNREGNSPLHIAAQVGHTGCLRMLLERGADIHKTNDEGQTVYSLACRHGHHECARLLRALHWASDKDANLSESLQNAAIKNHREKQMKAVQTRIKQERGEIAYQLWRESKNLGENGRPESPAECQRRRQVRSKPNQISTCGSCSQITSQYQSGSSSNMRRGKASAKMKISLVQAEKNTEGIGRPEKLYPYTNYPSRDHDPAQPKSSRRSKSAPTLRVQNHSSQRVRSRTPSPTSIHCSGNSRKLDHTVALSDEQPHKLDSPKRQEASVVRGTELTSKSHSDTENVRVPVMTSESRDSFEELPKELWLMDGHSEDVDPGQDDWDIDEDELFHDVGQTNSLNALALPEILVRDGKSAAEFVQVLRFSSSFGQHPKGIRRINSFSSCISSQRSSFQNKFQRRFSLGCIPEGQMVTSYSNDEDSNTLLLDDQFFAYDYTATREEHDGPRDGNELESDHDRPFVADVADDDDDDVFYDEDGSTMDDKECHGSVQLSQSDSTLFVRRSEACPKHLDLDTQLPSSKAPSPSSLNIVNIVWNPETNTTPSKSLVQEPTSNNNVDKASPRRSSPSSISPDGMHLQLPTRFPSWSPSRTPSHSPRSVPSSPSRRSPSPHAEASEGKQISSPSLMVTSCPPPYHTIQHQISSSLSHTEIRSRGHHEPSSPTMFSVKTTSHHSSDQSSPPPGVMSPNSLFAQSSSTLKSTSSFREFQSNDTSDSVSRTRRTESAPSAGRVNHHRPSTQVLKAAVFQFGGTLTRP